MECAYWYAWSQIKGIGPVLLKRIFEHFGSVELAWQSSDRDLIAVEGLGALTVNSILEQRPTIQPLELWDKHQEQNPHIWTPDHPHYPKLLWEIPDPRPSSTGAAISKLGRRATRSGLSVPVVPPVTVYAGQKKLLAPLLSGAL